MYLHFFLMGGQHYLNDEDVLIPKEFQGMRIWGWLLLLEYTSHLWEKGRVDIQLLTLFSVLYENRIIVKHCGITILRGL